MGKEFNIPWALISIDQDLVCIFCPWYIKLPTIGIFFNLMKYVSFEILWKFCNFLKFLKYWIFIIPSPTKLRGDIVTLPSVRHNPCEHSRINILQWILTKLGTYLVLKENLEPYWFSRSKVKVTGSNFYRITSLWTL